MTGFDHEFKDLDLHTNFSGAVEKMPEGAVLRTHDPDRCSGEYCVIHNPSGHHMVDWPMNWRADTSVMERICPHGIGHPDPDDTAHRVRMGLGGGVHGCDGCCTNSDMT